MKAIIVVCAMLLAPLASRAEERGSRRTPVVVELFTSEGCSSCPAADEQFAKLAKEQPVAAAQVIPLAFHVDYWNKLGWPDRFSSPEFTQRQYEYSKALQNGGRVYTPQMIVDGVREFVGSDADRASAAITEAASKQKGAVEIAIARGDESQIVVRLNVESPKGTDGQMLDLLVAVTESNLVSDVKRGENAGRKLHHAAVVRVLKLAASTTGASPFSRDIQITLSRDKSVNLHHASIVAFVQDRETRRILAAGAVSARVGQ